MISRRHVPVHLIDYKLILIELNYRINPTILSRVLSHTVEVMICYCNSYRNSCYIIRNRRNNNMLL